MRNLYYTDRKHFHFVVLYNYLMFNDLSHLPAVKVLQEDAISC